MVRIGFPILTIMFYIYLKLLFSACETLVPL